MKRRSAIVVLALVALAVLVASALAQVPAKMNYQVMLTNDSDEPLVDQAVTLVFRIYNADTGGVMFWNETHVTATNSIGVVSAVLGTTTPISATSFNQPLWVEVEVDGETLSPRRELTSSPYALHAYDADRLGMTHADDYALEEDLGTPGTINDPSNPVHWTMLKSVPAGFADGIDDVGGAGDGHSLDADDGDPVDAVYVEADGTLAIGGTTNDGLAKLYANGASDPSLRMSADPGSGGQFVAFQENGLHYARLAPDFAGTGGYMEIVDGNDSGGFAVDGNYLSGDARVIIIGSSSSTQFNTNASGDDAVVLPNSSVSSPEIQDEAGVASSFTNSPIYLTTSVEPLRSRTILVPAPGFVAVMATAEVTANHSGSSLSSAYFGLSDNDSSFPMGASIYHRIPDFAAAGTWHDGVSVTWLFDAPSAGAYTFYFLGQEIAGDWSVPRSHLTLIYFPTYYGLLAQTVHGAREDPEQTTVEAGHALTEADIAAERAESEAFNSARIERELEEMEAKIAELRASIGNGNTQ